MSGFQTCVFHSLLTFRVGLRMFYDRDTSAVEIRDLQLEKKKDEKKNWVLIESLCQVSFSGDVYLFLISPSSIGTCVLKLCAPLHSDASFTFLYTSI